MRIQRTALSPVRIIRAALLAALALCVCFSACAAPGGDENYAAGMEALQRWT